MATPALGYLRELVTLTGPSGREEDVVRAIVARIRPLADSVEVDAFGNVVGIRRADREGARTCVLAAHMDEVGFRIRMIEADGFLRFEKVGGTDTRVLLGQRIWVRTARGRIPGVIGTRSAHLLRDADRTSVPPHNEQYIDIGARSREEAQEMGVRLGDGAGFAGELTELGANSGRYTGHALDDRVGCAVVLAVLDELRERPLPVTVTALFTVQEEVGLRGAHAGIHERPCDLGIAIDTTALDDTPEIGTSHLRLGAGPAIKIMDGWSLTHPAVQRGMEAAAERAGIQVQHEILPTIGTDAGALQFGGRGTPVGTISIGTRYTHSPVELLDRNDLEGAVALLRELLLMLPAMDLRFASLE